MQVCIGDHSFTLNNDTKVLNQNIREYDTKDPIFIDLDGDDSIVSPSEVDIPATAEQLKAIELLEQAILEEVKFSQILESELTQLRALVSIIKLKRREM